MESINVLVLSNISEECRQRIANISPRIKLTDVSGLLRDEQNGDLASKEKLDTLLAEADVLFGFRLPRNALARAPRLKWVQVMSAGVERYLNTDVMDSPVMLANVSGIHAIPIGEFVLGLMLMFVKQAPLFIQSKQEKRWERQNATVLRAKTVGIVGLGSIGREVARLAKAFGMRVLATRRKAKKIGRARYVDTLFPPEQLQQLLAESDFVVMALPFTPETSKIIGEKELRTMKPSAYLINIARGGVMDEEALTRALEEGWIAGAGLDVFATEPLPADSRLWELPNVIISPHISGMMDDYVEQSTEVFAENLRRYLDGKRLLTMVDKQKGY
ncbi:D-2-hydroxyacid dehydrogenase [Chloroflexota bacterium]